MFSSSPGAKQNTVGVTTKHLNGNLLELSSLLVTLVSASAYRLCTLSRRDVPSKIRMIYIPSRFVTTNFCPVVEQRKQHANADATQQYIRVCANYDAHAVPGILSLVQVYYIKLQEINKIRGIWTPEKATTYFIIVSRAQFDYKLLFFIGTIEYLVEKKSGPSDVVTSQFAQIYELFSWVSTSQADFHLTIWFA